jgi:hypothetical protein
MHFVDDPCEDPVEWPEITPAAVALSLPKINLLKARGPLWLPPVEEDCLPFLGGIAISWGGYEQLFLKILIAAIEATNSTDKWTGISYDKRCDLLRKHMRIYFAAHPLVVLHFEGIVTDSFPLQFKRNLLVHGHLSFKAYTKWSEGEPQPRSAIVATGRHKGQYITQEFGRDELEDLYYALLNLAGRLNRFSGPISLAQLPHFSLQDLCALQEFLRLHFRPLPPPTNPSLRTQPQA